MRWSREFTFLATAAATVGAVLGFAAPAHAAYTEEPISLPWNPAGPVHSSAVGNGVVYLGGKLDGTGGIAAIDAATGNLLWMVPANGDVRALALSADGTRALRGRELQRGQRRDPAAPGRDRPRRPQPGRPVEGQRGRGGPRPARPWQHPLLGRQVQVRDGVAQKGLGRSTPPRAFATRPSSYAADNDVFGLALTGNRLLVAARSPTSTARPAPPGRHRPVHQHPDQLGPAPVVQRLRPVLGRPDGRHQRLRRSLRSRRVDRRLQPGHRPATVALHPRRRRHPGPLAGRRREGSTSAVTSGAILGPSRRTRWMQAWWRRCSRPTADRHRVHAQDLQGLPRLLGDHLHSREAVGRWRLHG